jgi:probable rRNA maturation factor
VADYDGALMGCTVTFHDRIGHDRLEQAVEPLGADAALALVESAVCETVAAAIGPTSAEVELTLAGDAEMERLNFDHMGERGPTDVLSFPLHEWSLDGDTLSHMADDDGSAPPVFGSPGGGPLLLGDVVIDLDQALRQAAEGDWGVAEELVLLAIHGTLHLLGHDHAELEEEQRMRALEHQVLGTLHRRHREIDWQPGSLFDRAGHAVTTGS